MKRRFWHQWGATAHRDTQIFYFHFYSKSHRRQPPTEVHNISISISIQILTSAGGPRRYTNILFKFGTNRLFSCTGVIFADDTLLLGVSDAHLNEYFNAIFHIVCECVCPVRPKFCHSPLSIALSLLSPHLYLDSSCTSTFMPWLANKNVQPCKRTSVQIYNRTTVQTYKRTNVQTYDCTNVQKYKYTTVQMYNCTNAQTYKRTTVQTYKRTIEQTYNHTKVPPYNRADVQTYKRTNVLMYKRTNVQTYKRTTVQTYTRTNVQLYNRTNVQRYKSTHIQSYKCRNVQTKRHQRSLTNELGQRNVANQTWIDIQRANGLRFAVLVIKRTLNYDILRFAVWT